MELLTMNRIELDRLAALRRYAGSLLTQEDLARQLGLSERQVRRLLQRLETEGEVGLVSRRRGKTSNNRLDPALPDEALALVRERYLDFGPTFANEKLREVHGLMLSTESLRKAMIGAGLWATGKSHRPVRLHLPRPRRPCRGELVQVDGSHHDWFETRGRRCVLMNAVDDATSTMVAGYFALRFDVDSPCDGQPHAKFGYCPLAATYWQQAGLPEPNIVILNPQNGHCHIVYQLRGWLQIDGADARQLKAVRYHAAVERAYTKALKAEPGYPGLLHHNPLSPRYKAIPGAEKRTLSASWPSSSNSLKRRAGASP